MAKLVRRLTLDQEIEGSNPSRPATLLRGVALNWIREDSAVFSQDDLSVSAAALVEPLEEGWRGKRASGPITGW